VPAKTAATKADKPRQHYRLPLTFSEAVTQIGTTGIRRVGPYVREEYLRELQGRQGRAKFRQMYNNDVVRRAIRAVKLPMLAATWTAEGAEGPDADKANEFLEQQKDDMVHSWHGLLDDVITGTSTYGASVYQVLYKRRLGSNHKEPDKRSQYDDGLWGWAYWSPRGQETWEGWVWDEDGRLTHLRQLDQYASRGIVEVPLDRSVHFVIEGRMGDPNGESLLRAAYEPWYGLKHADNWIGILTERMGGIPVFRVTDENLALFDDANPEMASLRAYLESAGTAFRIDEHMAGLIPYGIEFEVEAPPIKVDDLIAYIRLCSWRILGSVLAQFLELGQAPQGSYAKSQSDKEFFLLAEEALLGHTIAETINRQEVPRLFGMNAGSFNLEKLPRLVPSDLQVPTLADLAGPLKDLTAAMVLTPGPALEEHVRNAGKLPKEEEAEEESREPMPNRPEGEEPGEDAEKGDEHWTVNDLLT